MTLKDLEEKFKQDLQAPPSNNEWQIVEEFHDVNIADSIRRIDQFLERVKIYGKAAEL